MAKLLASCRLLVVEDEMMVLMLIEDMLADLGCELVSTAASVGQALALLRTNAFDLAMLDMNLKGERSDPVAHELAARRIPFVFSTGYSGGELTNVTPQRPVLKKPFRLLDLERALGDLLFPAP